MKRASQYGDESGMALLTTLMVLLLASALMVGFFAAIVADQRANGIDRDQTQAYAAAHAGLEKLTSDLATKFETDFNPTAAEINALAATPPVIPGFSFTAPGGTAGSGYAISFSNDGRGNPAPISATGTPITAGPYQGFNGIITQYTITSTARSTGGAEVRLRRMLETVSVPVFQFGVFSETDLTFFAGDTFNFGGRVHTNGNLYLAETAGDTLTLSDKVTAVGEVIRRELSNGFSTRVTPHWIGTVNVITAPGVYRAMGLDEGSVKDGLGPPTSSYPLALNELPTAPGWTAISKTTYKSNIMNGRTGAKKLDLPLVTMGAKPIDLIRRPVFNETATAPLVYPQRFYAMASMRILLSDTAADITGLPEVTATAPVPLDGTATAAQYGPIGATRPPFATSPGSASATANATTNVPAPPTTISIQVASTAQLTALKVNATTVNCTGKTATTFTGCTGVPGGVALNNPVTSGTGSTVIAAPAPAAGAATITVGSTASFVPLPFWSRDNIITCTGYDATNFTGCTGRAHQINNGTVLTTNALSAAGTSLVNGFIKIEILTAAATVAAPAVWRDVTTEILNLGIASRNQGGTICPDPNPDGVINLQRLRDNGGVPAGSCYNGSLNPNDYWPMSLYDAREGNLRDDLPLASAELMLGGAMYYVELDVNNLRRWLLGQIGASGTLAVNQNGYIVYFSDRRNNRNSGIAAPPVETGEYGFEDVVNPGDVNGMPNGPAGNTVTGGVPEAGEDVNGNGVLDVYGKIPVNVPAGAIAPLDAASRPWITVGITAPMLLVNRPIYFRRALKLVNGGIVAGVAKVPSPGLTVVAENPVYVQGDYNATAGVIAANAANHKACAVIADAVTVLSNNWDDKRSYTFPNDPAQRPATPTSFRMAVVAGKNMSFKPTGGWAADQLYGTDGGVANFLRYIENWAANGLTNIYYRGSIVSLFFSRQAVGTYKCCSNEYTWGPRQYNFDNDFLLPSLLPPGTPMFRDVNTLTFRQLLRPNQ